ncbi:A/G-specific adenine glycosylase [bacterium]|nr:A/G-specific adenine glycosylase [bacterium]
MSDTSDIQIARFREIVADASVSYGRHDLPWRLTRDPYAILVSEVMLQQTQVARVVGRYEAWLDRFPSADALAASPLEAVLESWQGLGYNRRAVALKRACETIASYHGGVVPRDRQTLLALPGVGASTAAGVRVFAFGEPDVYLETNVRAVMIHHFFRDRDDVHDREIVPVIEATLDREDPRTWYQALLDYGVHLKRTLPNPSRRSAHHTRQSRYEGSRRQKRARLLTAVLESPGRTLPELALDTGVEPRLADEILRDLAIEGFLTLEGERYRIA